MKLKKNLDRIYSNLNPSTSLFLQQILLAIKDRGFIPFLGDRILGTGLWHVT